MQQYPNPLISRYNKKSKELLVDYINQINNRLLVSDQLVFGVPVLLNDSGLSQVEIGFSSSTGWDSSKRTLTYNRVDLNMVLHDAPVVVHVLESTPTAIFAALLSQYGLLLEPDTVELTLITTNLSNAVWNKDLPGFETADGTPVVIEPVEPAYLDNQNYRLRFKDSHLIFFGEIKIYTRRSLELLGGTIDSLMDLRNFYNDGNFLRPPVDLYTPGGQFLLMDVEPDMVQTERRMFEALLYKIKTGEIIVRGTILESLMRKMTGDYWVAADTSDLPFNLFGATVLYNGYVSKDYHVDDPAYNYVLALQLGPACNNLSGVIKIGYRYSDSQMPGNLKVDHAAVLGIFNN